MAKTTNLACGIVGLPNVGKSTLFNALTASGQAEASNYPFCTIDPNIGVVEVPDKRLKVLSSISHSQQIIPAVVQFVDIAGLVAGASKGEGLGNQFLANIRDTDAIVQVVRCFDQEDVIHVSGGVDPVRDVEVIHLELGLCDLQNVENIVQKLAKQARTQKEVASQLECLKRCQKHLDANQPLRTLTVTDEEKAFLEQYRFLTMKPTIYIANVAEKDLPSMENSYVEALRQHAAKEGACVIPICASLEAELAQLEEEDRTMMLADLGLKEPGLHRLIREAFSLLGLITYLTTGEKETRAWTICDGMTAAEAAGKIHTDIQKGFIRAEVIAFDDLVHFGSRSGAKEAGKIRTEGKEYRVKDGDVIVFLHN